MQVMPSTGIICSLRLHGLVGAVGRWVISGLNRRTKLLGEQAAQGKPGDDGAGTISDASPSPKVDKAMLMMVVMNSTTNT